MGLLRKLAAAAALARAGAGAAALARCAAAPAADFAAAADLPDFDPPPPAEEEGRGAAGGELSWRRVVQGWLPRAVPVPVGLAPCQVGGVGGWLLEAGARRGGV